MNPRFTRRATHPVSDVFVRVRARMVQTGAPNWNVRVFDNPDNNALYVWEGPTVNVGITNTTQNFNAPSGWTGRNYGNPRSAAPFAILDAIYDAIQFVLTADPAASFPPLKVNWNQNNATDAFFSTRDGIFLRGR